MPTNNDPAMKLPEPGRRGGFGNRQPPGRGRRRNVDIDKNSAYRSTSLNLSESFKRRLKMAADIEGVSMTEFLIVRAQPDVDAILEEYNLGHYAQDD